MPDIHGYLRGARDWNWAFADCRNLHTVVRHMPSIAMSRRMSALVAPSAMRSTLGSYTRGHYGGREGRLEQEK